MKSYAQLMQRIRELALSSGRKPEEIRLVVVTKTRPWEEIRPVYEEGCRLFGESRIQEALPKMEQAPSDIEWHLIGSLQKNKVKKAVGRFALIHSVDSLELAEKISQCSEEDGLVSAVLLQVNTSHEATKHGLTIEGWRQVYERVMRLPGLTVEGLMTIGPHVENPAAIRQAFASLRSFRDELKLRHLSMGMSDDYPLAIEEGATLLRVGRVIFNH